MGAATRVPATTDLEGGEALETLRSTGWKRLAKDSFVRFLAADGFSHARSLAYQLTLTAVPALIAAVGLVTKLEQDDFRSVFTRMLRSSHRARRARLSPRPCNRGTAQQRDRQPRSTSGSPPP